MAVLRAFTLLCGLNSCEKSIRYTWPCVLLWRRACLWLCAELLRAVIIVFLWLKTRHCKIWYSCMYSGTITVDHLDFVKRNGPSMVFKFERRNASSFMKTWSRE